MNIVLTGVTGLWNRGVEALVATAIGEIRRIWPDSVISVMTSDLERDRNELPSGTVAIHDASRFFSLPKAVRPTVAQLMGVAAGDGGAARALRALREADMAIALGGDIFSSDYGSRSLKRHVATLDAARQRGTKTVLLAQSIGPFANAEDVATMRGVIERSTLLTVRESLTQDYISSAFGIGPDRAVLTADIAFLLEPSPSGRAAAMLEALGLVPGRFVAMAASQGINQFSSLDETAHDQAWAEAIQTVLATTDLSVLIVPHVHSPRPANDDARIAFRLLQRFNFHPRVKAAFGPYTASDYKALIGQARFLIGERMHACIAALSSCVPLISIGYSVKARGIMGDIFGDKAEEYGLIMPVRKFLEPGTIARSIGLVETNFEAIRSLLASALPATMDRARENFARLGALAGSVREAAA